MHDDAIRANTNKIWRPVTEWEAICFLSDPKKQKEEARLAREIMTRSVCHLASSGREILYAADYENDDAWNLTLAMRNTNRREIKNPSAPGQKLAWTAYMRKNPLTALERDDDAWVEAAVDIILRFKAKQLYVNFFSRDLNATKGRMQVRNSAGYVDVAKVLMCFALAMGLEIFALTLSPEETSTVTLRLSANDIGSGKLRNLYMNQYGLQRESPERSYMSGKLSEALRLCVADWKEDQKCALESCTAGKVRSNLLQAIMSWKSRLSAMAGISRASA